MSKLKICFMIAGFGQGGAQKQCIFLLNELQKNKKIDLTLIYFYEGINYILLEQSNLTLYKVTVRSFYDPANIFKIGKLLKTIAPNILFSWLHASDVYSFFACKFLHKCKWIMAERDSHYPFDARYLLRNLLGKKSDLILCNSNKGKKYWLNKNVSSKKIKVVNNILPLQKNKITIFEKLKSKALYAGRLEPQKNVMHLTKVFCKLADIFPEERFYIIGDGSLENDIKNEILSTSKTKQVILLPFQVNIASYFKATNVFVNLSKHEGMPNTVIENIDLGSKIVVSNIEEHRDLLGVDYPFYVKNLSSIEEAVYNIKQTLSIISENSELSFAKTKLQSMSAVNVSSEYLKLFQKVVYEK